jgi:hypothetical protein
VKKHEPIIKNMFSHLGSGQVGDPLSDFRNLMVSANIHLAAIIDDGESVGLIISPTW